MSNQEFQNTYQMLCNYGHSPRKAFEIALDAKRGDAHAKQWVTNVMLAKEEGASNGRVTADGN